MNVVPFFIADARASIVEQPIERGFDDIADLAQSASMLRLAFGDEGDDPSTAKRLANDLFRVAGSIGKDAHRSSASRSIGLFDPGNRIHQGDRHPRFMHVRRGVLDGQWGSRGIDDQMTLRAVHAPCSVAFTPSIGGVRTRLDPSKSARVEQLSNDHLFSNQRVFFPIAINPRDRIAPLSKQFKVAQAKRSMRSRPGQFVAVEQDADR